MTRLILIEGLPGTGKSSLALHLGNVLQRQHGSVRVILEADEQGCLLKVDNQNTKQTATIAIHCAAN